MAASDLQTVLAILPKLAADDLEQVRQRIASLKALASNKPQIGPPKEETDADFVLNIIATTLKDRGVGTQSVPMMKQSAGYASFRQKVPSLITFLEEATRFHRRSITSTRLRYRTIMLIGVDLLYHAMSQQGLTTSSNMMMKHIHRVPSIIDRSFPGYAESGLLGWLAEASLRTGDAAKSG